MTGPEDLLELEEEEPGPASSSAAASGSELDVVDRQPQCECWALLAFDTATGCATKIVAIAGEGHGRTAVSWVPLVSGADVGWRRRLAEAKVPLAELLDQVDEAGGVGAAFIGLEPPAAVDLEGAVEMLMDELLAGPPNGDG